MEETLEGYLSTWEKEYNVTKQHEDLGRRFAAILETAYQQTGKQAVVLIDEYDKPLLDVMDTEYKTMFQGVEISLEENNRNVLKGFYSTFKLADEFLKFVLLTGVTKFSQVSVFSGFNQPADITNSVSFDTICGITEEEMNLYFKEEIEKMAADYECSYDEMMEMLKKQYDGYHSANA